MSIAPDSICAIVSEQTATGLRLAGITNIKEIVDYEDKSFLTSLQEYASDPEVAIIIINEKSADKYHDSIRVVIGKRTFPVIIEIPDEHGGTEREKDPLQELVLEAIGIDLA